jgi:hypothetical protein
VDQGPGDPATGLTASAKVRRRFGRPWVRDPPDHAPTNHQLATWSPCHAYGSLPAPGSGAI